MQYRDYYQLLGVAKTATEKEIKSAYRRLAQQYHPDKNPGDLRSEDKFKEINEAYEVLGDPQKRAKYDQLGASYAQWERSGQPGGGFDFSQWMGGAGGQTVRDLNDLFGEGGFSDFFTILFGGGRGPAASRAQAWTYKGEDQEQEIEVSLEEAYQGTSRTLQKGERRLEVRIPAGAKDGTKIRVSGAGRGGQRAGDLFLVVRLRPHPVFRRDGDDLHLDVPVDAVTAVVGGEVAVSTLAGEVRLTVPPESQAGKAFRLAGKGMPRLRQPGTFGDLYAHLVVRIPTSLSPAERALWHQLRGLRPG